MLRRERLIFFDFCWCFSSCSCSHAVSLTPLADFSRSLACFLSSATLASFWADVSSLELELLESDSEDEDDDDEDDELDDEELDELLLTFIGRAGFPAADGIEYV